MGGESMGVLTPDVPGVSLCPDETRTRPPRRSHCTGPTRLAEWQTRQLEVLVPFTGRPGSSPGTGRKRCAPRRRIADGAVAQSVARLVRNEKVAGSTPASSTIRPTGRTRLDVGPTS